VIIYYEEEKISRDRIKQSYQPAKVKIRQYMGKLQHLDTYEVKTIIKPINKGLN